MIHFCPNAISSQCMSCLGFSQVPPITEEKAEALTVSDEYSVFFYHVVIDCFGSHYNKIISVMSTMLLLSFCGNLIFCLRQTITCPCSHLDVKEPPT